MYVCPDLWVGGVCANHPVCKLYIHACVDGGVYMHLCMDGEILTTQSILGGLLHDMLEMFPSRIYSWAAQIVGATPLACLSLWLVVATENME